MGTVWIVTVGGHINSVWTTREAAALHVDQLIYTAGVRVRIQEIEVRD